jgi:hypothetical protein
LGKEKERLRVGGKREFPGSTHEGLLIIPAVQVDPAQGSTGALEARGDLRSQAYRNHEESIRDLIVCLPWTWLEGSET